MFSMLDAKAGNKCYRSQIFIANSLTVTSKERLYIETEFLFSGIMKSQLLKAG